MKQLILYIFLVVITNPYQGINYNQINVYDVNYCSHYCPEYAEESYDYMDEEEIEELEDDIRDEYKYDKPAPFDVDFWKKD